MFEPATLLGLLTLWAQLNNYGIDTEKNPHLKDIRVRRAIEDRLYGVHNVHDTKTGLKNSVIMKSVLNGIKTNRIKRNDYAEDIIPLASYPSNSPYYSKKTAGVPYHYSPYTDKNTPFYGYTGNRGQSVTNGNTGQSVTNGNTGQSVTNGNTGQIVTKVNTRQSVSNSGYTGQSVPTGYDSPYQSNTGSYNRKTQYYRNTQTTSSKYVMPNTGYDSNGKNLSVNNNNKIFYNPYGVNNNPGTGSLGKHYNPYNTPYNQTVIPLYINANNNMTAHYNGNNNITANNGNNNIIANNGNNNTQHKINNDKTYNISTAAFISGIGCPKFMQSITLFGRQVCVETNNDY